MNDKMKLEETFEKVNRIRMDFFDSKYKDVHTENELAEKYEALGKILQYIKYNSIPKKKIEKYLEEETEKYKVYKKEVKKNENLRGQLWHHMGAKNMCERILGIEKTVTLD